MYDELVKSIHCCFGFEEPAVTDCENCMMKDKREEHNYVGCCDALGLAAADAIKELTADLERSKEWETFWEKEANEVLKKFQTTVASMPRWIPVEERLPQETQRCIVVSKCGEMAFAIYKGNGFQYPHFFGKVTHWMPLPEPPKEE